MDDEQALRAAASGEVYRTTQFANDTSRGHNYVTTLPSKLCERVGLGERVGVSRERIGESLRERICRVPGVGESLFRSLQDHFEDSEALEYASESEMQTIERIGPALASRIKKELNRGPIVVVIDPDGSDVAVSRSSGSQARLSAASVMDAFGIKERVRDGESVPTLWVSDGERLFGAVPEGAWFLRAIGAE